MKNTLWSNLLVDLKLKEIDNSDFSFLYKLLKDRDPKENISHKAMPSYKEHIKFVKSKPYQKWYIIEKNRKRRTTTFNPFSFRSVLIPPRS